MEGTVAQFWCFRNKMHIQNGPIYFSAIVLKRFGLGTYIKVTVDKMHIKNPSIE